MDWLAVAAGTIGMFATPLVLLLRPKAPDEEAVERTEAALQHSCQHELY